MNATLTTTVTRANYRDAISDAIADAEDLLGTLIVMRIECAAVIAPTFADPNHVIGYEATVESRSTR